MSIIDAPHFASSSLSRLFNIDLIIRDLDKPMIKAPKPDKQFPFTEDTYLQMAKNPNEIQIIDKGDLDIYISNHYWGILSIQKQEQLHLNIYELYKKGWHKAIFNFEDLSPKEASSNFINTIHSIKECFKENSQQNYEHIQQHLQKQIDILSKYEAPT